MKRPLRAKPVSPRQLQPKEGTWLEARCAGKEKNGKRCEFVGLYLKGPNDIREHFCHRHLK